MKKHLFLIGFMGCGKTYWGRRIAEALEMPFVDLDVCIEQGEQDSIAGLFARIGEDGFRALEQHYLHQLVELSPAIVATGGGTPCFFDNLAWMQTHGVVLWLDVPLKALLPRLIGTAHQRPLLADATAETIAALWQRRRECYQKADIVVSSLPGDEAVFGERLCAVARAALKNAASVQQKSDDK